MTAHNLLTAAQALAMVEAIGVPDARRLIADRAAAGLVKSYSLVIETAEVDGPRSSVRGAAIACELWRRIISEDATDDVWGGGTVRLKAAELVGGAPEVHITGITFHPAHIQQLADQQRPERLAARRAGRIAAAAVAVAEPVALSTPQRTTPDPTAIPPGAILCTIKQAGAALGFGRTKVNDLMNRGRLERRMVGSSPRITVASVEALAATSR